MSRLKTLALLGAFVVAGRSGFGADGGAAPASVPPAGRSEPPAPPIKYLQAGAKLFNEGRYEAAGKYLAAAHAYRDKLAKNEQIVLDVYQERLGHYLRALENAKTAAPADSARPAEVVRSGGSQSIDPGVVAASASASATKAMEVPGVRDLGALAVRPVVEPPTLQEAPPAVGVTTEKADLRRDVPSAMENMRGGLDVKQKARWLLSQAREHIHNKRFDAAEAALDEARALNVTWGYFDDTPKKVAETLVKARDEAEKKTVADALGPASAKPGDRRAAKARLREARAALAAGKLQEAAHLQ